MPKPARTGEWQETVLQRQAVWQHAPKAGETVLGYLPQQTGSRASAGYFFPSFLLFGILQGLFAASSASTRTTSARAVTDLLCTITCLFPRCQPGIHKQPGLVPRSLFSWTNLRGTTFHLPCRGKAGMQTPNTSIKKAAPESALLGLAGVLQVS